MRRTLEDGTIAEIVPLTFRRARINLYDARETTVLDCW